MTPTTVVDIGRHAVETLLLVSAPMLGAALITGLIVSIFQAATQVNEMTLSFIPKLIAVFAVLVIGGPWMITIMTDYMRRLYSSIPSLLGQSGMISVTAAQLDLWMASFLFPLARVMGLIAAAPIFSNRAFVMRARLALGLLITFAIVPTLPPSGLSVGTWPGTMALVQQMLIGIALGFTIRIVFAAVDLAGELIGLQMGLGFAMFYDPDNASQSPVIAEFLGLMATLIFLSINGHLMLLAVLGNSFEWWPVGADLFPANGWLAIARWGSTVFSAGLMLALPLIAALLVVNIALAVLTRAAPALNLFAIGFPVTLIAGFVMLLLSLSFIAPAMQRMFEYGLETVAQLAMG